jgi:serine protease Do
LFSVWLLAEGQRVIVIGRPEGLEETVSHGIISAFRNNRSWIQITAAFSAGSSGSPVLDESGQVIGIATSTMKESQNLNFAVSVEMLKTAFLANAEQPPTTDRRDSVQP